MEGSDVNLEAKIVKDIDIVEIRRRAKQKAEALGFHSAKVYRIVIAVSELAHNLLFHSHFGGTIRVATVREEGRTGIEIVSADRGPGIADIDLAMQDGYSTNGGLGSGLPGVKRLMDEFTIQSQVGTGTTVAARIWLP